MTAVEELQDTTSGFGWPASLKVYRRGEHVFFEVQAVVELLGDLLTHRHENDHKKHN